MQGSIDPRIAAVATVITLVILVWSLWDLVRRPRNDIPGGNKWGWLVVFVLFAPIGQIVYAFLQRRKRDGQGVS
jgi:hypothetical protein